MTKSMGLSVLLAVGKETQAQVEHIYPLYNTCLCKLMSKRREKEKRTKQEEMGDTTQFLGHSQQLTKQQQQSKKKKKRKDDKDKGFGGHVLSLLQVNIGKRQRKK